MSPVGDLVLAIDVGLTNCKAVLFDLDGAVVRRVSVGYETRRPGSGRVEQDPAEWWRATVEAVRALPDPAGRLPGPIAAIGVTAHMHALACVDANLRAIGPALVLGDRRAAREADEITAEVGAANVYATTGTAMDASMPAAKVRWVAAHEPETLPATAWLLGCKDYLRARLTGEVATEPVDACATSIYDIRTGEWSAPMAAAARAPLRALPPVRAPESIAGTLHPGPAAELGLPAGTPVIIGAGDDVEVVGNGLLSGGACLEHLGTTGSILAVASTATPDPAMILELYPNTLAGLWVVGGSMTTAGAALDWAARNLGFASMSEASACLDAWPVAPDAPVFLPDLEGSRSPVREPRALGAWLGLRPATARTDLMLAAFEGVAMGLQSILARTEALVGRSGPLAVSNGDSADPRWLQVRADIYARPLAVLETTEPTALGLLTLAAAALGVDRTPADAVRRIVRVREIVEPRDSDVSARRREIHEAAFAAQAPTWPLFWTER
jgi:xylulokinase